MCRLHARIISQVCARSRRRATPTILLKSLHLCHSSLKFLNLSLLLLKFPLSSQQLALTINELLLFLDYFFLLLLHVVVVLLQRTLSQAH